MKITRPLFCSMFCILFTSCAVPATDIPRSVSEFFDRLDWDTTRLAVISSDAEPRPVLS